MEDTVFPPTHWSAVLAAAGVKPEKARQAFEQLCADYRDAIAHWMRVFMTPLREFENYTLLGEIAGGGMGVVYQAVHRGLNRSCALKLIRAGLLATPDERRRFVTEAEAAAKLDHPHIVRVDAGKRELFERLQAFLVEGTGHKTFAELAQEVGMTEEAVKKAAQRMRRR